MKDGEKTYSTSQIAGIVGLHPIGRGCSVLQTKRKLM